MKVLFGALVLASVAITAAQASVPPQERTLAGAELARAADRAAIALLDDRQPAVAARAALALGRSKQAAALAPLLAHAGVKDPSVRAAVAFALGLIADKEALPRERAMALGDRESAVRYAAVDALGRIAAADKAQATPQLATDLLGIVRADRVPLVRAHAAVALEAFRDAANADDIALGLAKALDTEYEDVVRWHEMWTIFRAYATRVPRTTLEAALHDPVELVRVEAARAWGRRTEPDAADVIRSAFDDASWHVQYEARESLKRILKQDPAQHLTEVAAGLHLPPLDPPNDEQALPRTSPSPAAGPPVLDDLVAPAPLVLNDARRMDGPMPGPHPRVRIRTTKGDLIVRLYPEWAPFTVANFLKLTNRGYFDGNRWFRIVPDFVVQTGDPNDNGEGDAGYTIPAEENPIEQESGIISMGLNYENNAPKRDSAGSQFYITLSPQFHLDRDFTVFGRVVSGNGVLARLIESDRIVRVDRLTDH
ncbi:MAG: peptidylprolyl isomerase [Candidatus Eremiobacteraeota bacterium]|nr:peptidylprolyl isomerase [Candidatus Eremiobacteraeota bacterium]